MAEPLVSPLEIQDSDSRTVIILQSIAEDHGAGSLGNIIIQDTDGNVIVELGRYGSLVVGGSGLNGAVFLKDGDGDVRIRLDANTGDAVLGGNDRNGEISLIGRTGTERIHLDATRGDIVLRGNDGTERIRLNDSDRADILMGGSGRAGNLRLFPGGATDIHDSDQATIHLNGESGDAVLGGSGSNGAISLRSSTGPERIRLDADTGDAVLGGNDRNGEISLISRTGTERIHLDATRGDIALRGNDGTERIRLNDGDRADILMGGNGRAGNLRLFPGGATDIHDSDQATIHLNGESGDIFLGNADCAEDFDTLDSEAVEPGSVMVIDPEGKLQPCNQAYDRRVAGVISGACECKPGIVLNKRLPQHNKVPLALVGKVYCKADAQYGPIEVGDLLTTAPHQGHAMKVSDPPKAFGAVIGKALCPLREGNGLIPILIALQ